MISPRTRSFPTAFCRIVSLALLTPLFLFAAQQPSPAGRGQGVVISSASRILPPANFNFPVGQKFVYDVEWRLWNAGSATLSLAAGDAASLRASASATSSGVVSVLYPVRDRFESVFEKSSFCSQSLVKHTEEGFHARETLIAFNYARGLSILDETNLKNNDRKHQEKEIPGCVTDVISGIFYVASLPLRLGASYTFPLNDGGETVDVTVRVEAKESLSTPAGEFKTIRVSPQADSGPVKDKGKIWIWYTDDASRVPVQMRARMFWGTLTFRLQRLEQTSMRSNLPEHEKPQP